MDKNEIEITGGKKGNQKFGMSVWWNNSSISSQFKSSQV